MSAGGGFYYGYRPGYAKGVCAQGGRYSHGHSDMHEGGVGDTSEILKPVQWGWRQVRNSVQCDRQNDGQAFSGPDDQEFDAYQ